MAIIQETSHPDPKGLQREALLIGAGWLGTGLGMGLASLPITFLLKDEVKLIPSDLALFTLIGNSASYVKPLLGVLTDCFPLCGTRRYHYLLLSLTMSGLFYLLLGWVPRTFFTLLVTYMILYVFLNLVSTVMGGLMVDTGLRYNATGRLSAQRVGISRGEALLSGPVGAELAKIPFQLAMLLPAAFFGGVALLFAKQLREPPTAAIQYVTLQDAKRQLRRIKRQLRRIVQSRTLWSAAGLVMLVIMAPGFGTPLLYYQTNTLGFTKSNIGFLTLVGASFSILAALLYAAFCRRIPLRKLLGYSIVVHAIGTLFYLLYHDWKTALAITALEGLAQTMAVLPLYDLAARATPKGCEALGYSVMMSVWNFTNALSNYFGSWLYDHYGWTFRNLIWLNAGTTALVLIAVPLLPAVLMDKREGES